MCVQVWYVQIWNEKISMCDEQSLLLVKEIAVFVEHHIDLKYIYIYIYIYINI